MNSCKALYLIDGSSYIYRAFYALPPLSNSKGFPTNAIYGFINMLKKLIRERNPDYLAIAFDHKAPTFRHQKFKEYKITRKPIPEPLKKQIPLLKEIIQGYNIPLFEVPGYEADDVLAYIAIEARKKEFQSYIVSSDKDILQVVKDKIYIYHPQKDIVLDEFKIEAIYGIPPALFADFLALRGDQIDNIPGIPGIGEKTAKELIKKYGGVEEILKNLNKLSPKLQKILKGKEKQLLLNKELSKINTDMALEINLKELELRKPNYQKLIPIFENLEFKSLTYELLQDLKPALKLEYKKVKTQESLYQLITEIELKSYFAFYPGKIDNSAKLQKAPSLFIALDDDIYLIEEKLIEENKKLINRLFQDKKIEKISYELKGVIKLLRDYGIEISSPTFDLQIIAYLLNPSWENYALSKIALNYLESGFEIAASLLKAEENKLDPLTKISAYCHTISKSYFILKSKLKESNLERLYYEIEEPLMFVLLGMEERGIRLDRDYLNQLLKEYQIKINKLSQEIFSLAGETFNPNSPKQLREILYNKLNLKPFKKGKTGPSTDESTLRNLSSQHPLPNLILKYRELNKIKTTYIEGLLNSIDLKDSKIHTTFNQTITQTGRLSCSNPNLQNIPIRSQLGRQIRRAFIPSEEEYLFLSADYSQIELRILAHLSKDEQLIRAFKEGRDIHSHTAALLFGIDENIVSEEMRTIAKTVNFGIIYGISAYGLSRELNIPSEEASKFIKFYFQLYPGVKLYIERVIAQARQKGYVSTLFNRIRYLPEINALDINIKEFGERLAINTPIQGTAADLIKKVMVDINREIKLKKIQAYLLLQIHDELLFELPRKNLDLLINLVTAKMGNALTLEVPLVVNIKVGSNWLDLQKMKGGING